jgi:acyl-coenzyme A synthetase/AMP-(fatty) acid ligase
VFISPTAVRVIRKEDPKGTLAAKYALPKLRSFFMAGEICDRDTSHWIEGVINRDSTCGDRKQVVDHWWQTESGWPIGATCLGLGEKSDTRSLNVGKPVPGWNIQVLNSQGKTVGDNEMGSLAVKWAIFVIFHLLQSIEMSRLPLPPGAMSMMWRNDEKFVRTYFTKFPVEYCHCVLELR